MGGIIVTSYNVKTTLNKRNCDCNNICASKSTDDLAGALASQDVSLVLQNKCQQTLY